MKPPMIEKRVVALRRQFALKELDIECLTFSNATLWILCDFMGYDKRAYDDGAIAHENYSGIPIKINNNLKLGAVGCEYEN